jgi:hypothetical protein
MSCTLTRSEINGWLAVRLSNPMVEITVLPQKGADIYSFVDVASGIDVLLKTPWGLQPPGAPPRRESDHDAFLHNYEGAWQELFPNTGPPCMHNGLEIPLHGEVATLPWETTVEREGLDEVCVRFEVHCQQRPFSLTRRMRLAGVSRTVTIEETVHNTSNGRELFVWGHHPVLGAPFLEAGCILSVDRCTVYTPDVPFDSIGFSYECGQRAPWPYIRRVDGQAADLRLIPGADADTHDIACLTELRHGWVEVQNPRLGLAFALEWDSNIFRWINNWRPFGGVRTLSLQGIYGLAVEPWTTRSNLASAVAAGVALSIEGGAALNTSLMATLRKTA